MSWKCRLVDKPGEPPEIGDMWFIDSDQYREYYETMLSAEYKRDWKGKRKPLVVRFPPGFDFCIDEVCRHGGVLSEHGWTVTGVPPNVTVSPSVNFLGVYHGWIQNGVITDDCEGRKFA